MKQCKKQIEQKGIFCQQDQDIDMTGYHHIINRGVDNIKGTSNIFHHLVCYFYDYQKQQKWRLNGRGCRLIITYIKI